jgi:hypothetical protein
MSHCGQKSIDGILAQALFSMLSPFTLAGCCCFKARDVTHWRPTTCSKQAFNNAKGTKRESVKVVSRHCMSKYPSQKEAGRENTNII